MTKYILSWCVLTYAATVSCSEIEDGSTDIDTWPEKTVEYQPGVYTFSHPCALHTGSDFSYVKNHLAQSPWAEAYTKLQSTGLSDAAYQPSPVVYLARLDANNWAQNNSRWENAGIANLWYEGIHTNFNLFCRDCQAAYQLALRYRLEGDAKYAQAAINVLNAWANNCNGLLRNKKGELIDPNEYLIMFQLHQFCNAAELVRDYEGWSSSEEFKRLTEWLDANFYPTCSEFLKGQGDKHSWMNWDLAQMTAILSMGILEEDREKVNEAILYFKQGPGPGCILGDGVVDVYDDPDGTGDPLAQGNESGRDQGHNTLCAAMLGAFCQMAYNIGEDLFSFENGRAMAFAQYVAKYNYVLQELGDYKSEGLSDASFKYAASSLPFTEYFYCDNTMSSISSAGRGTIRPGWDLWASHVSRLGIKGQYVKEMAARFRPDGGGGNYGSGGGYDQLGFSTLMYYKP